MTQKKNIYFASDAHFGAKTLKNSIENEKRFVRWLDSIKHDAEAVYLVGDMIDFWFEYKHVVPKGFTRFLGKLAELTDMGVKVHWFIGNHDIWIFGYIQQETGVIVHHQPLIKELGGKKFFIGHGDGLGDNSVAFKIIRSVFHNKLAQRLFAWIHPDWAISFALAWSKSSRESGSREYKDYLGEDKEHLVIYAKKFLQTQPEINFFVFGHRHIMLDLMLKRESRVVILGDWIQHFSYAVWDGNDIRLEQFEVE